MRDFEVLCSGFDFLECPTVDSKGRLFFVDRTALFELDVHGVVRCLLERPIGGLALHKDGGLVVSGGDISLFRDGALSPLLSLTFDGEFNDICVDQLGRIYAGTVLPKDAGPGRHRPPGDLWRVECDLAASVLYSDVGFSNGLGFAPDGRRLYHADTYRRQILIHDISDTCGVQVVGRRSTAAARGLPDGLAVDEDGCLWIAMFEGGCVARFDPDGNLDSTIGVPADRVTNLCFAGSDRRDLVIVGCENIDHPELGGCIFRTRVTTPGLPVNLATVGSG